MNYLGHMILAHDKSEAYRFGSMAPDFAKMHRTNITPLPHYLVRSEIYQEFYDGAGFHGRTDSIFDANETLQSIKQEFGRKVAPSLERNSPISTLLVRTVGVDLLFDGVVLNNWSQAPQMYRRTLRTLGGIGLSEVFESPSSFMKEKDRRVLNGPPDYGNPNVVARILHWRVGHIPKLGFDFEEYKDILTTSIAEYQEIIQRDNRGLAVIQQTAERLGVSLPETTD